MTLAAASPSPPAGRLRRPLAVLAGAALLAPTLVRPGAHGPILCPMRRITGVWCPTCGMTRAVGWLVHGDLHQSLRYHPLAPVLLIEGVIVAAFLLYRQRAMRDPARAPSRGPERPWAERTGVRAALVANALLVLVVWVVRLTSGSFDDLG